MLIAKIVLPRKLYRTFDYLIPNKMLPVIKIGTRVNVPFGSKYAIGIVVDISNQSDYEQNKLKKIQSIIDLEEIFSKNLWKLLLWGANYYQYPIGEVLFHALPTLLRQGKPAELDKHHIWQLTEQGKETNASTFSRSAKQKKLLDSIQKGENISNGEFSTTLYQALHKKNIIEKREMQPTIEDWHKNIKTKISKSALFLNEQQSSAISIIQQNLIAFSPILLDGVTGSGKTEVYLDAIESVVLQGKQALVLVPEIGLTPQTIKRFQERFQLPIVVLHSSMSNKARLTAWLQCKKNQIAIAIGTRSALFTPFHNLGIIIIDEEHDSSYKQQDGWRYHARDLAIMRAKIDNIPIILGSATPSLETLHNALSGKFIHLTLSQRAGNADFAKQSILDIKGLPLYAGLSKPLIKRMAYHLAKDNQVILFLNRRGFSPLLLCHDCSWIAECPNCDKPYTYHQTDKRLICHHCDSPRSIPLQCPKCGSTHLIPFGFGTEKIEQELKSHFIDVPITRIDRDSTRKKNSFEMHFSAINVKQKHILIGTQILAKGHHFPDVTLVGIVDVDGALFSSDFRATERFAQIYTQVSGRAGRESKSGEVILQTYHPDHPLLTLLLTKGYSSFAKQTLAERKMADLPPFSHQAFFYAADRNNQNALIFLQRISNSLQKNNQDSNLLQLGPSPCNQPKKAQYYRWQLLLQHNNRAQLHKILRELIKEIDIWPETKKVKWNLDIDPIDNS